MLSTEKIKREFTEAKELFFRSYEMLHMFIALRKFLYIVGFTFVTLIQFTSVSYGDENSLINDDRITAYNKQHLHKNSSTPPNIIFIVLDTARADRMSYNGYKRLTTPNIDQLARDSVIYRNAHSVSPWTLPSHMSMFTGLLPGQHGATMQAFAHPEDMSLKDILSQTISPLNDSQLLPKRLKEWGYSTIGFTSNSWVSKRTGFDRGFDYFYELWKESKNYKRIYQWIPAKIRTHKWFPSNLRTLSELDDGDAGKVLRVFKQHINTNGDLNEPFFLFFNFIDPHYPYSPPTLWRYTFSDDLDLGTRIASFEFDEIAMCAGYKPIDLSRFSPFYDAEMNYVDFAVGQLITWLREKEYYDKTLIIVVSDHGEHIGEGGHFSHQYSVEEELLWIPLVIKYPGSAQRGLVIENQLVSNLDIYETILQAASPDHENVEYPTPSQNLRDMKTFDRSYLIAEYYYSLPYLRISQKRFPDFSIEENTVVRRVVYDLHNRYVFVEQNGKIKAVESNSSENKQNKELATVFLLEYIKSLGSGILQKTKKTIDKETLKQLRSLGYLD